MDVYYIYLKKLNPQTLLYYQDPAKRPINGCTLGNLCATYSTGSVPPLKMPLLLVATLWILLYAFCEPTYSDL